MIEENEFIASLRHIELSLQPSRYSSQFGIHHLVHHGRSLEFAGYQEYRPGDDLKDLDWKLFARSDRYYIKQRDSHTHATTLIILDDSPSMGFFSKSAKISKFRGALLLAFGIGYVLYKQGDAFGFQTLSSGEKLLKPHSSRKAFRYFTQQLQKLDNEGANGKINFSSQDFRNLLLDHIFFISDFLVVKTQWKDWLGSMNQIAKEATCYHIIDPEEEHPDPRMEVRNIENTKDYRFMTSNDWQEYRSNFRNHRQAIRQSCVQNNVRYHALNTNHPIEDLVRKILSSPRGKSTIFYEAEL